MTFEALAGELTRIFRRGVSAPLGEEEFNGLALRVFRFQCEANVHYAGFVGRRGLTPGGISDWRKVPFLPTRAFKSAPLISGDPGEVQRVFRTSGTSLGKGGRGAHHVLDLNLYRESLLPNFRTHLLPEGGRGFVLLCLLPSPLDAPDSSLSFMMGEVVDVLLSGEGRFFVREDGRLEVGRLREALGEWAKAGTPVLLAGTAFSFVRWLEAAGEEAWSFRLPEGSRIMETGGYKGRSRAMPREDLYQSLSIAFGIPVSMIVNEYGMTELLSQFYEPMVSMGGSADVAVGGGSPGLSERFHRGPPWTRTLVLDPLTLEPVPEGHTGILAHFDLANLGSVSAVLTDDLGQQVSGGFRLLGRTPGSEPRGCSLAMEEFISSLEVSE